MLKDMGPAYAGAPTSSGSRFFDGYVADFDSTITERYRKAGLVILAKTSTPELGLNATTEPVLHGPTRHPWNPAHSSGGSSGGAAAPGAARGLPAPPATHGGGSIPVSAPGCGRLRPKPARRPH